MIQTSLGSELDISLEPFNRECMLFPTYAKRNPDKSSEWIVHTKGWAFSHNSSTTKQKMMMSITRSVAGKSSADQTSATMFEQRFKYFFANNKRNKEFAIQAIGTIKDSSKTEMSKMLDNLAEPLIEFDDDYKTDHLDWTRKEYLNQNLAVSPSAPNHIISTSPASTENSVSLSLSATHSINSAESTDDNDDEGFDEDPLECGVHLKTKNSGFLSGQFSVPHDNILNWAQQQNQCNARLIQIQSVCTDGNKFSRNYGIVDLIEPTGISVISDIDDTIKDTKILSGARAVLSKTFFEEPQSVQGMADAYNYWYSHGVSFHYVSNSPFQLMPMLDSFIQKSRFPPGSMHLRTDGSLLSRLVEVPGQAKREAILEILHDFPQRRFILVGDSGEIDLEIYTRIASEFPNQILKIFIRDVTTSVILARSSTSNNNNNIELSEKKRNSTFTSLFPKRPGPVVLTTSPLSSTTSLREDVASSANDAAELLSEPEQPQPQPLSSMEKLKKLKPPFGIRRAMTATLAELTSSGDSPKPLHRAATTPNEPENLALEACTQLYDRVRRAQIQIPNVDIILFEDPKVMTKDTQINDCLYKYVDDTFNDSAYDETSPVQPSTPVLHSI
ncbi:hypothetical protein K501DRAFT_256827 [Backusella circina FSU 941]|nr:hypothetical protein K501DRAFT_256827 [Backusella circina FSU 941]